MARLKKLGIATVGYLLCTAFWLALIVAWGAGERITWL